VTLILLEVKNNGFIWIDIAKPTRDEMKKLAERFPFHELNLEDCLSKIQIPKIDRYEDHVFIILNFPTLEKERIPRSSFPHLSAQVTWSLFIRANSSLFQRYFSSAFKAIKLSKN
jgi:Mg2+ and Co2+ transporter CorA